MTDETIYSKIYDKTIHQNLQNSEIWKDAHKEEELDSTEGFVKYSIRFDGLKPVQVLKIKKINEKSNQTNIEMVEKTKHKKKSKV